MSTLYNTTPRDLFPWTRGLPSRLFRPVSLTPRRLRGAATANTGIASALTGQARGPWSPSTKATGASSRQSWAPGLHDGGDHARETLTRSLRRKIRQICLRNAVYAPLTLFHSNMIGYSHSRRNSVQGRIADVPGHVPVHADDGSPVEAVETPLGGPGPPRGTARPRGPAGNRWITPPHRRARHPCRRPPGRTIARGLTKLCRQARSLHYHAAVPTVIATGLTYDPP